STGNLFAAGFTPAGVADNTFGTSGVARLRVAGGDSYGINPAGALTSDGRVVAAAVPSGTGNGTVVTRWTLDGKPDTTFGVGGITYAAQGDFKGADLALQPEGAIVLAGLSF